MHELTKKPQGILFDWDNTLVDSWPVIYQSLHKTFQTMGHEPWSFDDVRNGREGIHGSLRDSFPKIFGDKWEEAKQAYFDNFLACHLDEISLLPGAQDCLELLHKSDVFVGIVSNKTGMYLREELEHLGLSHYFSSIVGATDAAEDKPAIDPVILALKESNLTANENIWLIGDSMTDIQCAHNANCTAILFGDAPEPLNYRKQAPKKVYHAENHALLKQHLEMVGL